MLEQILSPSNEVQTEFLEKMKELDLNNLSVLNKEYNKFLNEVEYSELPYYSENEIIDETKSVKWNKEEVERLNLLFKEDLKTIGENRNFKINFFEVKFIEYISKELNLSFKKSKKILENIEILAYNKQTDKYDLDSEDDIDFESEIKNYIEFMKSIFEEVLTN